MSSLLRDAIDAAEADVKRRIAEAVAEMDVIFDQALAALGDTER